MRENVFHNLLFSINLLVLEKGGHLSTLNTREHPSNKPKNHNFGPTQTGKLFTTTPDWQLRITQSKFELKIAEQIEHGHILDLENVSVRPGIFWAAVTFLTSQGKEYKVDGIPNENARALVQRVRDAVNIEKRKRYIDELIRDFSTQTNKIVQWVNRVSLASKSQMAKRGWLSKDFVSLHNKNKPTDIRKEIFTEPEIVEYIKTQPANIQSAIQVWQRSFVEVASGAKNHSTCALNCFRLDL